MKMCVWRAAESTVQQMRGQLLWMLSQLFETTPCGIVAGVPGLSQMTHSCPLCVSAAWDGFISSVLASSNHPRQSYGPVGSVVPQSRGSSY